MWLELCEVNWFEAFGSSTVDGVLKEDADSATAGAASGAPEGREKKTAHATRGPETNVSLTDSNSPSSREASESDESESDESASSGTDTEDEDSWLFSSQKQKQRREGISALLSALKREGCPVPNPSEFQSGLLRFFSGEKCKGERFDVARALGAQKQHFFLGKLEEKFKGESFHHRSQRFFCEGFPSLAPPAPGGDQIVEFVSCRHPMWEALQRGWGVNTIPDFLKHLCSQHDGEVRLLSPDWAPAPPDVDVRHPAFWTPQFVKEGASRRWLAERKDTARELLNSRDVWWLFQENGDETTVLKKYTAASGAPRFAIRHGTAVTLAQMYYHGEESCTAFDIYKLYVDLPILVHTAGHDSDKGIGRKRRRAR